VHLGARTLEIAHDVGHTSLVAEESCKVDRLGGVVLGESLAPASVAACALTGQKAQ
jgi:hypothetical protein